MTTVDGGKKEKEKESSDSLSISVSVDKVREMQISGHAEEVELKAVSEEKDISIKVVELDKKAELEKDITKAVLVVDFIDKTGAIKLSDEAEETESKNTINEEKYISMHRTEISVASIPLEERKDEVLSNSKKTKRELEELQAGVKYHKILHTKKAKFDDEGETILPRKELEHKNKNRLISKLIPDLLLYPTHLCHILAPKKIFQQDKSKKKHPSCIFDDFNAHLVWTNLNT